MPYNPYFFIKPNFLEDSFLGLRRKEYELFRDLAYKPELISDSLKSKKLK